MLFLSRQKNTEESAVGRVPFLTQEFRPFPEYPGKSIYAFGPGERGLDWGLQRTNGKEIDLSSKQVLGRLILIAEKRRLTEILAPNVSTFNAVVCKKEAFFSKVPGLPGNLSVLRGTFADGVVVPEGSASWQASADCWTCFLTDGATTASLHCGLACLHDRNAVLAGKHSRRYFSVIEAAMQYFPVARRHRVMVFIACGISPENYRHPVDHPEYGEGNKKLIAHFSGLGENCVFRDKREGRFNVPEIVKAQLISHGVPAENISVSRNSDGSATDTYGDTDENGRYLWHSYRRDRTPKRNALLFVNAA